MAHYTVNPKDYALFDYEPYLDGNWTPISRPTKLKYDLGDVVYIRHTNAIGVVIGCIDSKGGELRTDMDGMVGLHDIEFAKLKHFRTTDVNVLNRLKKELNIK